MAQGSSNSTMEMGTSDQGLVGAKKKTNVWWIVGGVVMVILIAVAITLAVVFSGNEGAGDDPTTTVEPTTESSTPSTISTAPTAPPTLPPTTPEVTDPDPDPPTTPEPTTTTLEPVEPEPEPEPEPEGIIQLPDVINGAFTAPSFNGTWVSGSEVLYRDAYGHLMLYDVDSSDNIILVSNTSQILQQSSRVTALSADRTQVVLARDVVPVYRHSFTARYTSINLLTGEETEILPPQPEEVPFSDSDALLQNFVWSPTGTAFAFVHENNIYYQQNIVSDPVQITTTGVRDVIYHGTPDWVYEEEIFSSNIAMWFSDDGSKLAYGTFDDTQVRIMRVPHYGVPGSVEYQYTYHHQIRYPKSGTENPTVSVTIRDLETDALNVYNAPTNINQAILRNVRFASSTTVAILWTNRVQNQLVVELCTLGQAACNRIFEYSEPNGWIDNIPLIFNGAGNAFITILPQAVNGVLYKQIVRVSQGTPMWTAVGHTNTAHTVLEILAWTSSDVIWYKATHVDDSAQQHIYTVDADGEVSCFTCEIQKPDGDACLYNDGALSAATNRIIVNCAGPSVPQIFIYNTDGARVGNWDENAAMFELVNTLNVPEILRIQVPVQAGLPDADVHLQVPDNYESLTMVPLLVYVYGGPDSSLVTKQWSIDWGTSLVNRWNIAVAHIDGRGSGLRGVDNTFALNRRLGTIEVEDQITVTRYLQENYPWLDSNRTCIWGWSYGGYAASLALARGGDVFRCAAAVAPVVDWRYYDTIYTERYMEQPVNNVQGYADSTLLTDDVVTAYRDKRYFLIHGTADDNVHYQHAMLFSRLLQRQDVYFTQMSYTDEDHGLVGVRPHLYHALEKFLQRNML